MAETGPNQILCLTHQTIKSAVSGSYVIRRRPIKKPLARAAFLGVVRDLSWQRRRDRLRCQILLSLSVQYFPGITRFVQVAVEGFRGFKGGVQGDQRQERQVAGNRQPGTDTRVGIAIMAGWSTGCAGALTRYLKADYNPDKDFLPPDLAKAAEANLRSPGN